MKGFYVLQVSFHEPIISSNGLHTVVIFGPLCIDNEDKMTHTARGSRPRKFWIMNKNFFCRPDLHPHLGPCCKPRSWGLQSGSCELEKGRT